MPDNVRPRSRALMIFAVLLHAFFFFVGYTARFDFTRLIRSNPVRGVTPFQGTLQILQAPAVDPLKRDDPNRGGLGSMCDTWPIPRRGCVRYHHRIKYRWQASVRQRKRAHVYFRRRRTLMISRTFVQQRLVKGSNR